MLFHMSIEADNPSQVANVIAELWGGVATHYPMVADGAFCALAGDDRNTMIVIFPRGTRLVEGQGTGGSAAKSVLPLRGSATHMAIASDLDPESVVAIAQRENWRTKFRRRGRSTVAIEIWIDDCQLLEVMTPEMQRNHLHGMTVESWLAFLEKTEKAAKASIRSVPVEFPARPLRSRKA